uniref:F-box/FBD/LRR-repeat protein At1g13570-like n=1 Tax=Erigeron canadensis TaxID=72917 RepID=UPI001CB8C80D|nr:F-box/FBD/LRR-repeat protein At1g13570-like [Erigeron canadensis]XP_043606516.1 F-box/FBD/LRR-repeat protein At1g13570-like [Erigeron canadensis]XP_043606524.1 F-box/FBD/LRR-repeat protein At1g13570-like [Erigeron canadensis]XP_043606532.1 F-box/FBD/LRR-repeat protein At1g13570-like [Erigeron canadensis]
MDMISKLPPSILETILCLLPIQEAGRTSILSKEWRYHWTKIPKLAFIENTFQESTDGNELFGAPSQRKTMTKRCKLFYAIYQILLMHEGPLHEVFLSIDTDQSCVEIDHIIFHLSRRNTVKKLTLDFIWGYQLPISLFSLRQLTELCLIRCDLYHQPTFDGFGSLTSLFLKEIMTSTETLLHLLSNCPLLKTLELNLVQGIHVSAIVNLFQCLPVIENLSIWFQYTEGSEKGGVPLALPTALVYLKNLAIESISFIHRDALPFVLLLIRSSPNLEKLKIELLDDSWVELCDRGESFTLENSPDIWLERLYELEIVNMFYRKTELDLVKLILANAPVLKKVTIFVCSEVARDEELKISGLLLGSPHASPVVEIIVEVVEVSDTSSSRSVM